MARRPTVLVSGMLAGDPHQGGASWAVLQYVLGFERLGHEVWIVEPVDRRRPEVEAYFGAIVSVFGLERRAALLEPGEPLPFDARPDILVNISGMLRGDAFDASIPIRVYLDLDPAFNQLWHAVQGIDVGLEGHTHYVTVGQAIGRPGCSVPTCGLDWVGTLPPVVLDHWTVAERVVHDALTTVGNWRGYGSIEHEGIHYGQKAHSLRRFIELPTLTDERFALALSIHPDETRDIDALTANRWQLLDPASVAGTPAAYREFIQGSKAEFAVAKSGYVESRCGWFSDRSACYLASGRPAIVQQTGLSEFLPTGAGLFAFESVADVLAAIDELRRDYGRHARAARAIAEEYLDSDRVLTRLLTAVGAGAEGRRRTIHETVEAELAAALDGLQVTSLRRRPSAYRSSAPITELEVTLANGATLTLLAKDLSRQALHRRAREVKPEFLHDPLREIDTYRLVLEAEGLGTPAYYGSVVDPTRDRYWLVIEKVRGIELYQVGELEVWCGVLRWLARLHERFAGCELPAHLLRYDRELLLGWRDRAEAFADVEVPGYEEVVEDLLSRPATLLHGELYPSNVLVDDGRVCPVDWELAGAGPARGRRCRNHRGLERSGACRAHAAPTGKSSRSRPT